MGKNKWSTSKKDVYFLDVFHLSIVFLFFIFSDNIKKPQYKKTPILLVVKNNMDYVTFGGCVANLSCCFIENFSAFLNGGQ